MDDLLSARLGFAMSLGFHIIFAAIGIGMPMLMVIAELQYIRTRDEMYLTLAKRWAKGSAILFAIGAVSGTIIAFQLGLLWPGFMRYAGSIIGMPFSLEGSAFFTEAIFLGIYLYGWDKISPKLHVLTGGIVALSGAVSGIFVVCANAWMNNPEGFKLLPDGKTVDFNSIDPFAAMFNRGWFHQTLHMTLAAYLATGAAVVGIHAYMLIRNRESSFHRKALGISLGMMAVTALLQPISGHISAQHVAKYQPEKLAALEGQWETKKGAPLRIGGYPDVETETTKYAIEIPYMLSILAFNDPHAEVKGLKAFPKDERPNPLIVHTAFQIMVGCGSALIGIALLALFVAWRQKGVPDNIWVLRALVAGAPLGFIAIEAGWTVTECGRQPWIIYRVLRTADAVTPVPNLIIPMITFMFLYLFLAAVVVALLKRQIAITDGPHAMDRIHRDEKRDLHHH